MEAVLKNVSHTVELLSVAALGEVVLQWDLLTLSRAFQWARYCEHLYSRFHDNAAIRRVMEQQLQLTNQRLQAAIPAHTELSFSELSRCQHLLLIRLLNNAELPCSILKILFDPAGPANVTDSRDEDVTGLCSRILHCRSACKVLRCITGQSPVGADAEVQGGMMMERLEALLSQAADTRQAEQFLLTVLQGYKGAEQRFCLVIAAALLTRRNSQTASQDFLVDWLQSEHCVLQRMCSTLPASLLADLAKEHLKFRDVYYSVLRLWASGMEYNIDDGEWLQNSMNCTVTFQKVAELLLALCDSCPSLRSRTMQQLQTLKAADGDFDVNGLSVWGDLLSTINHSPSQ